jgi:hypothetical protein
MILLLDVDDNFLSLPREAVVDFSKARCNASHVSLKRASVNSKFLARARQRFPRSSVPGEHIVAWLIVTPHSFRNIPSFA